MNRLERIEFLKTQIDEARSEGLNNVANMWCDELAKEQKIVDEIWAKPEVQALVKKIAEW